jgi:hypothetical protein
MLMRTETLGQAIAQIGLNIEQSIVGSIVDMGVRWAEQQSIMLAKWIATKLGMAAADKGVAAANVAALIPIATATSLVWAAPAALAAIATFGGAAAAAPAEIAAAMGITQGIAVAGFDTGGYTSPGRRDQPAGVVHAGEWVAPQWQVNHPVYGPMISSLEAGRQGKPGYAAGGFAYYAPAIPRSPGYADGGHVSAARAAAPAPANAAGGGAPARGRDAARNTYILMDKTQFARLMQEESTAYFREIAAKEMRG